MKNFNNWLETDGVFSNWDDRKADQTSYRYIDSGFSQLQQAHPELASEIEHIKEMFANVRDKINAKHWSARPIGMD